MRKAIFNIVVLSLLFWVISMGRLYAQRYTISGMVYEKGSKETLLGVSVYAAGTTMGTSTNSYGFYSLTLPSGEWEIVFSSVGYQAKVFQIDLQKNVEFNVELDDSQQELEEVAVYGTASKTSSRSAQMSVIEVPVKQLKALPALLGEKDALKIIQLMPGVQSGTEGTSGFYVRGGGPDQNLIILDDATVYNANHLFGFFSLFNGDAVKSIELTKGGFPARYGGRLSSVLDINLKDGNKEEFSGEGGIGLISSRLVLEGPLAKDKSSFIVSGRRTYIDVLTQPFLDDDFNAGYFFYDLTAKVNWQINSKNKLYMSSYFGKDKFYMKEDYKYEGLRYKFNTGLFWDNATATVRWNSILSQKLFSNLSLIFSNYRFKIFEKDTYGSDVFSLSYRSGIRDVSLKYDFSWHPHPSHSVRFGVLSTWHQFTPTALVLKDSEFDENLKESRIINSLESGIYVEDEIRVYDYGKLNVGTRISHYLVEDKQWVHLEPRISGSYYLSDRSSLKASYAQMNQNIHLLSSTGIGLPTDLWLPATKYAPPQNAWQVATGFGHDVPNWLTHFSIEGYYKKSSDVIAYKEGASFLMLEDVLDGEDAIDGTIRWEDNITHGDAWSYGVELLAHRTSGRFSGWIGYTLSWTQMQFNELNFGEKFFARYDRRHDVSVVGVYELSDQITLSASWIYGTGNAVSLPLETYEGPIHTVLPSDYRMFYGIDYYDGKNTFRMESYHRLDVGVQFHKKLKRYESTWEVSVYNLYNRKNPFIYITDYDFVDLPNGESGTKITLNKLSLFPIIPSVSWSFKF